MVFMLFFSLSFFAGVMVWGCFSANGRGRIRFLETGKTMNSVRYISIMEDVLPLAMAIHRTSTYMQDNAPCHR